MFRRFLLQFVRNLMFAIDPCTLLIQVFPLLTFYYNSLFEFYLRAHLPMHAWPSFRVEMILFWVYFHLITPYKQIVTLN